MIRPFLQLFGICGIFLVALTASAAVPTYGLSDLYRTTVGGAESVRAKTEERIQSEEELSQVRGALLPTISGIGTYTKSEPPSVIGSGYNGDTLKQAKLTGKGYLFRGGSEYAALDQTNRALEGKEAEVAGSRIKYFVDLSSAYYDALLKQALRNHARTELQLYDTQIGELRSRVKIGRTRASDLLSVEAARAGSQARLRASENALLEAKLTLANLARLPVVFELREEAPTSTPLEPLERYLSASVNHPDLIAARKARDASEAGIAIQRGFHLPSLDLSGNYYLKKVGYPNDSKWDATLTLTVPIFAGGVTQSEVRRAASVYRENEINTTLIERNSQIRIRTLHETLVAAEAELKAFAEAVELATKSYDRIHKDYSFGLVTNLDVLNSMQTLTDARRNYDQARFRHFLNRARLEAGTGKVPFAEAG